MILTGGNVGMGLGVGVVGGGTMQVSIPSLLVAVIRPSWQTHWVPGSVLLLFDEIWT